MRMVSPARSFSPISDSASSHLATARKDVDGAVVVVTEERAVGGGRLGELVDLLAQGGDVLAGLTQGVGELLVL
jgi:hypothetical protein